jgi:hypothetical protein
VSGNLRVEGERGGESDHSERDRDRGERVFPEEKNESSMVWRYRSVRHRQEIRREHRGKSQGFWELMRKNRMIGTGFFVIVTVRTIT